MGEIVSGLTEFGQKSFGQKHIEPSWTRTKSIWPYVIQDIKLLAKFMLDNNILDKPIFDKMILDEVFSFFPSKNAYNYEVI